ncbi:cobaltochelatase CobN [Rhodoligotrophos appendicifer]|uniref:cobaltochelatase subunit CobN n=1 Tax=Rhodoligotrophos appendicifer TaxID=987056 RepID=UPI001184C95D|nr:cobaltochelatase subunit CobN [Rhodoligotrophos appendicifer]
MHILARETRSLDEADTVIDLDPSPADIVFLSFSDSDLGAVASAWEQSRDGLPSLQLANLKALRHPMSVDLYLEKTMRSARCVIVRLLGGVDYWPYGAAEVSGLCKSHGIALALLDGDNIDDARLNALSTLQPSALSRLRDFFRFGGQENLLAALQYAAHLGGLAPDPDQVPQQLPAAGEYQLNLAVEEGKPSAALIFYRAYLLASDLEPITTLAAALAQHFNVRVYFVTSLQQQESAAYISKVLREVRPSIILNATAFAARRTDNGSSPLDVANVPVLQVILSGSSQEMWQRSTRGLSETDLAMHVVLPELDGRLLTTAISFKAESENVPGTGFTRTIHAADPDGVNLAVRRAVGWARLSSLQPKQRRLALVLSDYPAAKGQIAHAVGLDALASAYSILNLLAENGYGIGEIGADSFSAQMIEVLTAGPPNPKLTLCEYLKLFQEFPLQLQRQVMEAWGGADEDRFFVDGAFCFRTFQVGAVTLAIQPDRGSSFDRKASYHDPEQPPRHGYIAFYLWLRAVQAVDAMIHLGTHGSLEWLPGKAVALSKECAPTALLGGLPVIYPFIVNNPGEAAVAKRRLGAVTIGHLTPPLRAADISGNALELEKLLDEYGAADGLDRRRMNLLRREILERAGSAGLLEESGVRPETPDEEALTRLDAFLCDVKDLQIRDGLHIFGQDPRPEHRSSLAATIARTSALPLELVNERLEQSAKAEQGAILAALDGRFIIPGPAGAPSRGRADVLPTGRNLYTIDPRAIPTRSAVLLAERSVKELNRRHLQDQGDWLRATVINVWGSTTLRTGGEDLALALVMLGVRPTWDHGSNRVTGFEILPMANLDGPRVDVTLRVSGMFRDVFASQMKLFDEAVMAVARLDEPSDFNPVAAVARPLAGDFFRAATHRIYGNAPGRYGVQAAEQLQRGLWESREDLAESYVESSCFAFGGNAEAVYDPVGLRERIHTADSFVHPQDHGEVDLLDSLDFAAHEGGFSAAAEKMGRSPALYHLEMINPVNPKVRTVQEEVNRVVRGRAANQAWIAGMMRHGYRGAAEIARGLDGLFGFSATLSHRFDRQFDQVFEETLGSDAVNQFLSKSNAAAHQAMIERFDEAIRRGLWQPRRNSVVKLLEERKSV